jgi:hypothetical protein
VNRRGFLVKAAGASAALVGQSACAPTAAPARLSVDYGHPGRPIPADFTGLSYESAVLAANDFFTPDNRTLIRLLRTLGPRGVLRIGGNTSERTVWGPPATKVPRESFLVTPGAVDRLALFLRALDWRLIYGLNLATGTAEDAAAEAAYVATAVGPQLLALQIGNEPDGFGQWSGVRPRDYDVAAFIAEWQRFYRAIRDRVPAARFAGPDVAFDTGWIGPFAKSAPDGLVMLTVHHYANGPASNPKVTLERLMQASGQVTPMLAAMDQLGRTYRLPYRIAETNFGLWRGTAAGQRYAGRRFVDRRPDVPGRGGRGRRRQFPRRRGENLHSDLARVAGRPGGARALLRDAVVRACQRRSPGPDPARRRQRSAFGLCGACR